MTEGGWQRLLASTKLLQPLGHRPNRGPEVVGANMAVICSITSKLISRKRGCLPQRDGLKRASKCKLAIYFHYSVAFVLSVLTEAESPTASQSAV